MVVNLNKNELIKFLKENTREENRYRKTPDKAYDFFNEEQLKNYVDIITKNYKHTSLLDMERNTKYLIYKLRFLINLIEMEYPINENFVDYFMTCYQDNESIQNNQDYENLLKIMKMFRDLGYSNNYISKDKITVYRGVTNSNYIEGFSWTTCANTARYFAVRKSNFEKNIEYNPVIIVGIVKKENIICIPKINDENEMIIDYNNVEDLEKIFL